MASLTAVLLIACLVVTAWATTHVVPDMGTVNNNTAPEVNLITKMNAFTNKSASSALLAAFTPSDTTTPDNTDGSSEPAAVLPTYSKTVYKIDESALVAPAPDPAAFGETQDPMVVQAIVDAAAELLDGQELEWNPDIELFPDSYIKYYYDETLLVICWKEIINNGCYSFSEVKIADGSQLRRAIADNTYGASVQLYPTAMAKAANAVVAINGDFYSYRQQGITVYQRQLYRFVPQKVDSCFFTADGDMLFVKHGEMTTEDEAKKFIEENDVIFSLAFGPVLIEDGVLTPCSSYPLGEINTTYSRAGIGMLGDKHYLLAVLGEQGKAGRRAPLNEFGSTMYSKHCYKAYTLDGGQTATIVFNNSCFNRVDWDSERTMSDIVYFATALESKGVS